MQSTSTLGADDRLLVVMGCILCVVFAAGCGDDSGSNGTGGPLSDASTEQDANPEGGAAVVWCASSSGEASAYGVMAVCRRCHTRPPEHGAPFALLTWEDTQQPFGVGGELRYMRMLQAVRDGSMPYTESDIEPPVAALSTAEKETLVTWLEQGARPLGGRACEDE
jgi:hypothetical protein